jgi:hypothetical protein
MEGFIAWPTCQYVIVGIVVSGIPVDMMNFQVIASQLTVVLALYKLAQFSDMAMIARIFFQFFPYFVYFAC